MKGILPTKEEASRAGFILRLWQQYVGSLAKSKKKDDSQLKLPI